MWTVVYMASNRENAEKLKSILLKEGLLVKLREVKRCGRKQAFFEILVPESEAEEAHTILIEHISC